MDLKRIEELYTHNIESYGIDSRSVGWNNEESQNLRFKKLLAVVEDFEKPFSLNELGCGYGELFNFCIKNGYKLTDFFGYDISSKMIESAKSYINDSRAQFYNQAEIHTQADYTITSGIFNVMFDNDQTEWMEYTKSTLKDMYKNSNKGISFNLLSSYVDYKVKDLYYADPLIYFDYCKRELSRKVSLLHDYQLFEWTIIVKK